MTKLLGMNLSMITNYLKTAIRNLSRFKIYSTINVIGLSLGLATVIMILLNIKFEYSYNNFHRHSENIFRIGTEFERHGEIISTSPEYVAALGPALKDDFPEIQNFVRLSTSKLLSISVGNQCFSIDNNLYVDSSFFRIFSFSLIEGDKKKLLCNPYSIVLTENLASLIFKNADPLGKYVTIENRQFTVTGVCATPPINSDIQFNSLISFSTLTQKPNSELFLGWRGGNQFTTYVELRKNTSAITVINKLPQFMWSNVNRDISVLGYKEILHLEPLSDIHLQYNIDSPAIRQNIESFTVIAILILIISCMNFVNLSTARGNERAKEVGIRKVLGAQRKSLVVQFLTESSVICLIALSFALMIVEIILPTYNNLFNKRLTVSMLWGGQFLSLLLILLVLTAFIAGFYPALVISNFNPINALKNKSKIGRQKMSLRKILVVFQFTITIFLIVFTLTINDQLLFVRSKQLGIENKDILVIPLVPGESIQKVCRSFESELRKVPGVVDVAASSNIPFAIDGFTSNGYFPEGYSSLRMFHVVDVDENFIDTYGIKLIRGKNFSTSLRSDSNSYLINESCAKLLSWDDPVGKYIVRNGTRHIIIGEIKNFNYLPLYYPIEPLIITNNPESGFFSYVSIKFSTENLESMLNSIRQVWSQFMPETVFEYSFLEDNFAKNYSDDIAFRKMFAAFSLLAIIISVLGLFGLVSYSISLRTKEIGIRKILGSSIFEINLLLIIDYIKWEILATFIAWPITFIAIRKWLEKFAYKLELSAWTFIIPSFLLFIIAVIIISTKVFWITYRNPIDSLRSE